MSTNQISQELIDHLSKLNMKPENLSQAQINAINRQLTNNSDSISDKNYNVDPILSDPDITAQIKKNAMPQILKGINELIGNFTSTLTNTQIYKDIIYKINKFNENYLKRNVIFKDTINIVLIVAIIFTLFYVKTIFLMLLNIFLSSMLVKNIMKL